MYMELKTGDSFAFDDLIQWLIEIGYTRSRQHKKGEFAVRGASSTYFPFLLPTLTAWKFGR